MIGVYNYTVWLTYLSLISALLGIVVSLQQSGHPYIGVFFLLFCGLCDALDGRVARTKKNRTEFEKKYGVQIDSLSDLVAFGVLPACIGSAMLRVCPTISEIPVFYREDHLCFPVEAVLYAVLIVYIMAAMIRLAYFNVTEEERQKTASGGGTHKFYRASGDFGGADLSERSAVSVCDSAGSDAFIFCGDAGCGRFVCIQTSG